MNSNDLPLLLSVEQAASAIGLSRTVFYARMMSGRIVSVKEGRRRLIPRSALETYVGQLVAAQEAPAFTRADQEAPTKATVTA